MSVAARTFSVILVACALVAAVQPSHDHVLAFDLQSSKVIVYVYKEGIFAFAADNHVVDAPLASGSFNESAQAVQLTVDATKMRVLDPRLSPRRRDKVQANMIGPDVLNAQRYPTISFQSKKIAADEAGHLTVTGDLTLHGQTQPVLFQVTRADATHFSGSAMVRQTAFGITPIRIAGGTVRVKDDVKVSFDIVLK